MAAVKNEGERQKPGWSAFRGHIPRAFRGHTLRDSQAVLSASRWASLALGISCGKSSNQRLTCNISNSLGFCFRPLVYKVIYLFTYRISANIFAC